MRQPKGGGGGRENGDDGAAGEREVEGFSVILSWKLHSQSPHICGAERAL
jgi:hypothetical protein